ncbi:hypothetical protein BU26DRAFT_540644 [Trematosphaeria pertusa]|uniref:Uncharacterized protein n=1 Tax=Trematosphaeria pertusa TaxID=390896 RepID=A0A6A6IIH1_9PLEO|nr:uncharacterized protein BU26DRAFT_540644 [Trematosphaeria pertusa]KAF2249370.1 hypothetical protein BU26DRAFT_540644 [Trematosphaeria pertusa]
MRVWKRRGAHRVRKSLDAKLKWRRPTLMSGAAFCGSSSLLSDAGCGGGSAKRSSMMPCRHDVLQLDCSPFAELAGFDRPDARKRLAATTKSGRMLQKSGSAELEKGAKVESQTFPGPLVLPHDDLNYDPDGPAQSFKSWLNEKHRNRVTPGRKTLYVAAVPEVDESVGFMRGWTRVRVDGAGGAPSNGLGKRKMVDGEENERKRAIAEDEEMQSPDVHDVVGYLQAFYHGMHVKQFPQRLRWVPWKEKGRAATKMNDIPRYVALQYGDRATRIRARPSPDGVFTAQLNLNDILDAAIAMLPADAYSILLLVDHDIYESEEDDFCCGRAYGGSRIAVVQSARYTPELDERDGIEYAHAWPMSHCKAYADALCGVEDVVPRPATVSQIRLSKTGPMRAAITATSALSSPPTTVEDLRALWLSRIARTASHELGHCLGMGHCVYYACNMQSTGGLREDARQPPYLCPVCEAKVGWAVACELQRGGEEDRKNWVMERGKALGEWCKKWHGVGMWEGLRAWLEARDKLVGIKALKW